MDLGHVTIKTTFHRINRAGVPADSFGEDAGVAGRELNLNGLRRILRVAGEATAFVEGRGGLGIAMRVVTIDAAQRAKALGVAAAPCHRGRCESGGQVVIGRELEVFRAVARPT